MEKRSRGERRVPRSQHYQHLICETSCTNEMLESFPNEESISERLAGGFIYDESVLELEDRLKDEFWRIVDSQLTERQREVLHLLKQGKTQMEVAKELGVNQSSVTKSLHGNVSYDLGKDNKKTYGGSRKRLNKIFEEDEVIQEILHLIHELREQKY
jgi:DNA-binding CsgD family transcriptional regulator